ncbi:uncharacterized protein LOC110456774 [Mizuhopecten yessoensis]|uniref:uncharacterized protein LOC110456774 n=1 Tax=Mizuhopecten yessoensis TaxID=6573 RepID=UPI000B4572B0|nr:uncharacterized protein LOC110456774 [Mizuhopecten yessoensis]
MQLRLPDDKLRVVKEELSKFRHRKRATKVQLQSLVGKLIWVSSVVYGGRAFLRRLINAMNTLRHKSHKLRFSADTLLDIKWWLAFMPQFNGKSLLLESMPVSALYTDACNEGAGGHWGDSWFYCNWKMDYPNVAPLHINEKEVVAATLAVQNWAPQLANKRVYIFSDNAVTVACINKCTSRNNRIMQCLRYLFWLSVQFNFYLTARHIPGKHNTCADCVSRLHDPEFFSDFVCTDIGTSAS